MNSTELRGFLTGLILGDGSIDKGIGKRAFRIKSTNFDFIDYVHEYLSRNTNFKIEIIDVPESVKDGIHRQPYKELKVRAHPYFNKKYQFFYDDYRNRRITRESLNWLTPQGLANWYMSDGYIVLVGKTSGDIKDRRVELATDRYSHSDVLKVKEYLENNYGYTIKLVRRKEGVYRIRFSLLSAQHFFLLIAPHIVPSMEYKIILPYGYQPKWMVDDYYNLVSRLQSAKAQTDNAVGQEIV